MFINDQKTEIWDGQASGNTNLADWWRVRAGLAAIVESSNDAIVSKTLDGTITTWNESAQRMFGYTADEMIGESIMTIIPADRHHEEAQIAARLRKGERIEQFETKRITKSRKVLDVSLTISPIKDSQGNIIGSSKIARDIGERKQEEQKKNDFIAMVSHELRTPLTSILSYIQVLLDRARKDDDDFTTNALIRAELQAKKMSNMVKDFLNLTRLEEGKIHIAKEVFELQPLIAEIVEDAQFLTTNHTIQIKGCPGIKVKADRDKIGQVLMNLLNNAIKYSPRGGPVTITCDLGSKEIRISVIDKGIGISKTEQSKLFDRFYRVMNEKIKTVSGFGIGLYLASEILRYHNSTIEVESAEGEGSAFSFALERTH